MTISSELAAAFASASKSGDEARALFVAIEHASESLVLSSQVAGTGDVATDFKTAAATVDAALPCIILFRLSDGAPSRWVLVSYVPESAKVRDKMLYASSRDDLMMALGLDHFKGQYQCTEPVELSYDAMRADVDSSKASSAGAMSEVEKSHAKAKRGERNLAVKASAMGVVPFEMEAPLRAALEGLKEGGAVIAVEIILDTVNEKLILGPLGSDTPLAGVHEALPTDEPRFFATQYARGAAAAVPVFIYSCPDTSPVRKRMLYSTCKATVLGHAEELGLAFKAHVEVRDPADFMEMVNDELMTPEEQAKGASLQVTQVARPTAQARGKRKKKKFVFGKK